VRRCRGHPCLLGTLIIPSADGGSQLPSLAVECPHCHLDIELIDSAAVADVLGLTNTGTVSVYRRRYPSFPAPRVDMGSGRCLLWLRADIEAWAAGR
jgi:predicted DNA-binding transcriptional regulator AlpA